MSTNKVSTQKVIAALKKAGLKTATGSSRFSSGYSVRGMYAEHPCIEIYHSNGSSHYAGGSYTQTKLEKLTSAASVLLEAGIAVLMSGKILNGKWTPESRDYDLLTLYVRKDGMPHPSGGKGNLYTNWDVDAITAYFADKIQAELTSEAEEQAKKLAQRNEAEKAQAERMAHCTLLNPTIGIDHNYMEGLFTTHVILLDGRMAVLTVAYTVKQAFDWDGPTDGNKHAQYDCYDIEICYITPSRYTSGGWERGTSNFTTGKGEKVLDAIRYWITRQ